MLGPQTDLFVGFAQCGSHGMLIERIEGAAGERDFALVMLHLLGANGEHHFRIVIRQQGNQHGGAPATGIRGQRLDVVGGCGLSDLAERGRLIGAIDILSHIDS